MDLESQLKSLLVERLFLEITPEEMKNDVDLSEYGVDSFLLLELVVAMEETFQVHFEPGDIKAETLKTINNLAALVRSKQ